MAEFVKVIKERNRMCDHFISCGSGCPMYEVINIALPCHDWIYKHPEKAEHIILKWAAEHPEPDPVFEKLKTILDSGNKDGDDILRKVVKWCVEDYAKQHD